MRVHSDQTEFCVSYDFLIASSRAPIVKAPLLMNPATHSDLLEADPISNVKDRCFSLGINH